jgi:hypothetical protein
MHYFFVTKVQGELVSYLADEKEWLEIKEVEGSDLQLATRVPVTSSLTPTSRKALRILLEMDALSSGDELRSLLEQIFHLAFTANNRAKRQHRSVRKKKKK